MSHLSKTDAQALYRKWDEPRLPLFAQPLWLDAVCGTAAWEVALVLDGAGQIQAALPYWPQRRLGLPLITHPPLTPRLGPQLVYPSAAMKQHSVYDFEEKTIRSLLAQLPRSVFCRIKCDPSFQNWYPFYRAGFRQTTAYTYTLNLQTPASIWPSLAAATRNKIRKAKQTLFISSSDDLQLVHAFVKRHSQRKSSKGYVPFPLLHAIDRSLAPTQQRSIYLAKTAAEEVVGIQYTVYDHHTAYNLLLSSSANGRQQGAAAYLLWHAMLQAARRVSRFDLEGSMIPGVARFFRGFGTRQEGYHILEKWG